MTQKVCKLVNDCGEKVISANFEIEWIDKLVRNHIIDNWESQDEPEHLKTIRDRILSNEQKAGQWLGLYQQILQKGIIEIDNSLEQIELRLSGLVVKQNINLRVYNPIYETIFDQVWVEQVFADLRPYAEKIKKWLASNYKDPLQLLHGQILKDAQE